MNILKIKKSALLIFSIVELSYVSSLSALPASGRLFQKNYGYKVSCLLCHADGGGTASNKYGKAFLRAGANGDAFKKIEGLDSDEDGFVNLNEILQKSNPGDKKSLPSNTGDWLEKANSVYLPQKELEIIFPNYKKFSAIEGTLNTKQIEILKSKIGGEPIDDDKVPTFYFAEENQKRVAVGQLLFQKNNDSKGLHLGIAVATSGEIQNVIILGGLTVKPSGQVTSYLESLKGKTIANLPKPSSEIIEQHIQKSVIRSLSLIQVVFGGI